MTTLAVLVVEYTAKLDDLERGTQRALDLMDKVEAADQAPNRLGQAFVQAGAKVDAFARSTSGAVGSSGSLAQAQAKAALAADKVQVAQAQAALALKRASDMAAAGKASTEQIALAQAKAAEAADKVKVSEANAAMAMEKVESVSHGMATALETDTTQANRLSETFLHLQQSISSVHIQLPNVGQSLLDFGNKLGGTITAVQGLYQGALNLGKGLLMPNASMEQLSVGFTTLLGSSKAAREYLEKLQVFADNTPFEMPQVADAAQKLIAMGTAAKDVVPTLTDVGDAMAGLGKGAADVDRVVLVFGQMRAAGRVTGQDMMQLTDQGIPAWKYLADAMHKTIPEVQSLSSKGLIPAEKGIEALRLGMHKAFGGDMNAEADTFLGRLSTLQDKAGAALRSFTGPLFDEAKGALTWLGNKVASPEFQKFAKDMGEKVGDALKNIGLFIEQYVKPGFQHFIDLGSQVLKIVNNTGFHDFIMSLQRLGDTVNQILVQPLLGWLKSVFTDQNVLAGATTLGGAFHDLSIGVDGLNQALKDGKKAWDQIQPTLNTIYNFIHGEFLQSWQQLTDEFNNNVKPAWDHMTKAMDDAMPFMKDLSGTQLPLLLDLFTLIGMSIMKFGVGIMEGFLGLAEAVSGFVGVTVAGWTIIYDTVTGHFDKIPKDMENMKNSMLDIGKGLQDGLTGQFDMMFGGITGTIDALNHQTTDKMQNMSDKLVGHSIIPDMVNNIVSWFQQLGPRTLDAVNSMIGTITQSFSKFAGNILNSGGGGGGFHIPGFATGVSDFSGGLAVVGERGPELVNLPRGSGVSPLSSSSVSPTPTRSRGGGSSGGPGSITIVQEWDGREMARYTLSYADQRVKHKFGNRSRS